MTKTIDKPSIAREVAALRRMTVKELRVRYIEVFGEATRSGNKDFLWKRIAWRMQANAEGGLTERARRRAEELANDADVRMRRPPGPPSPSPASTTQTTKVEFGESAGSPLPGIPGVPGTILTRTYKGRLIQVVVRDIGFEFEGEVYGSLSAVAKAVTGSHWSGNLFFKVAGGKRG